MSEDERQYEVGYKKPPAGSRFKPGQSGNPKGRRKGYQNMKTDLLEELREKVPVTENGKLRHLTKQRVFLKRLCTKAINGDSASSRLLAEIIRQQLGVEPEETIQVDILPDEDEALLAYYLEENQK